MSFPFCFRAGDADVWEDGPNRGAVVLQYDGSFLERIRVASEVCAYNFPWLRSVILSLQDNDEHVTMAYGFDDAEPIQPEDIEFVVYEDEVICRSSEAASPWGVEVRAHIRLDDLLGAFSH